MIVMSLLKKREMSGSDIMNSLNQRTDGKWRPSPGSIYPILDSMLKDDSIELVRIDGKNKIYRLTTKGKEQMKRMLRHRPELEDRAQLGMILWFQFLDPSEQAQVHTSMLMATLHFLKDTSSNLSDSQKKNLLHDLNIASKELSGIASVLSSDINEE